MTNDLKSTSFNELFASYYEIICRQLLYLTGDPGTADDLAQETFLKLYTSPPKELTNPGGWLRKVATNLAYNYLKGEKIRKSKEINTEYERLDKIISFDEIFIRSQEVREVRGVLKKMSPRDRIGLLLKFSGYSYQEIAQVLEIQKSSVGTILARSMARFKEEYLRQKGCE
ncbi:RNA polymerase sigma factor SigX [Bacillota bacterium LX-D]|nr:RNA polymerase sigma factor SigX [Bacillota bacterium LX-D]